MDKSDGHAAFAHATLYSFDGVMAYISGTEHARQAGLQRKRVAIEFPGGEVAPGAKIAAWISLEFNWQPRRAGIGADHHKQGIGFVAENLLRLMRRLHANLNSFQVVFTVNRNNLDKGKNLDIGLRCNLVNQILRHAELQPLAPC